MLSVFVILSPSTAQITFERAYGGLDEDRGTSIQQAHDSGYIIVGQTYSFGAGDAYVYLIKTDSLRNAMWTRTYGVIHKEEVDGYEDFVERRARELQSLLTTLGSCRSTSNPHERR